MKKMDLVVGDVGRILRNPCYDCNEERRADCRRSNPKLPHTGCAVGYRIVACVLIPFMPLILFGLVLYYGLRRESKCGKQSTPES